MKKSLLIALCLTITTIIRAQIQDLANLANGTMVANNILYDSEEQVYGYIYFFNQGEIDKENIQFEYVLLDKNLNKVSNNTFTTKKYHKNFIRYIGCSLISKDELLLTMHHMDRGSVPYILNSFRIISIPNKTISLEYFYIDGEKREIPLTLSEYKKIFSKSSYSGIPIASVKNNGFFIKDLRIDKFGVNRFLKFYNTKNELQWGYEYDPNGLKNNYRNISIQNITSNNIYILESYNYENYPEEYRIVALNAKTGQKKYEYVFENNLSEYSHTLNLKEINNQLIINGNYSKYHKAKDFQLDKNLGFYKIILDENGKELTKKYSQWTDFKEQIDIDKNGRVEKNFRLRPTRFFTFKDGSICILTEKFKPSKTGVFVPIPIVGNITQAATAQAEKTTDFVLFFMDKDFNFKNIKTIQKDLSKNLNYDYLFSQYIKNDTGAVFFFKDYVESQKEWVLGVNSIINGELKEERIPISSKEDKYTIIPVKAKEGYIILREFNEKDKYNQLRLEKLNY